MDADTSDLLFYIGLVLVMVLLLDLLHLGSAEESPIGRVVRRKRLGR